MLQYLHRRAPRAISNRKIKSKKLRYRNSLTERVVCLITAVYPYCVTINIAMHTINNYSSRAVSTISWYSLVVTERIEESAILSEIYLENAKDTTSAVKRNCVPGTVHLA